MMDPKSGAEPFKILGTHLRYVRQQKGESLLEASGAVEIEPDTLERIEAGNERPPEDVLMLLINHFNVQDQEAVQLWESAGYDPNEDDDNPARRVADQIEKAGVVLLAMDARVMYTDGLHIDANQNGLTLNFTQAGGKQQVPVARVGMSYEQAEQVLETLRTAILYGRHASPRRLPPADKG
jgi:transcriptional regulator with XRE-family HTH domain